MSSMAFDCSKGSYLTPDTLVSLQDMVTRIMSATLDTSRTEYGSSLFMSKKISLCFLLHMFVELPGLGHRYALN